MVHGKMVYFQRKGIPFIVTIDPTDESNPQSAMANPKDAVQTPSGSYQKYTVLDEEIEVYLRVTKIDEETGKAVLLKGTKPKYVLEAVSQEKCSIVWLLVPWAQPGPAGPPASVRDPAHRGGCRLLLV